MKADNICVKCGANLLDYRTECTPLKCAKQIVPQHECQCDICECKIKSVTNVCSRCTSGWHNSRLKQ